MKAMRCCIFAMMPFLSIYSAQAQEAIFGATAPPGKWHWYHADFGSVSFVPPIIHTGEATLDFSRPTIRTRMELSPPDKDLHPFFRGKISDKNEVDGVFGGIFDEPQDPAQMHGYYRKRV